MGCSRQTLFLSIGIPILVVGLLGMIMGGVLPKVFDTMVADAIVKEMIVDEQAVSAAKWDDKNNGTSSASIAVFNVTNLPEVLNNHAKPILQKLVYKVTDQSVKYDADTVGDDFTYKSWGRYLPANPQEWERLNNDQIFSINPAYLGVMSQHGAGNEYNFAISLSQTVMSGLESQFLDETGALLTATRILLMPFYLGSAEQIIASAGITRDDMIAQWNDRITVNSSLLAVHIDASLTGFELPAFIPPAHATTLWDRNNLLGLFDGIQAWASAADEAARGDIGPESAYTQLVGAFSQETVNTILAYFQALSLNPDPNTYGAYLGLVKGALAGGYNLTEVTPANTWAEIGALQFGQGTLAKAFSPAGEVKYSLQEVGLIPAPDVVEWYAFSRKMGEPKSLSITEATNFLNTFGRSTTFTAGNTLTSSGWFLALSPQGVDMFNSTIMTGMNLGELQQDFEATGLTDYNNDLVATYLGFHLVGTMVVNDQFRGPVQPDGIGKLNGGLYTKRTPWEMINGYEDPTLMANSMEYNGLFGPDVATLEEERQRIAQANTTRFSITTLHTGKSDIKMVKTMRKWKGTATFQRVDDIKSGCSRDAAGQIVNDCKVWEVEVDVRGASSGSCWKSLQQDNTPAPTIPLFAGAFGRVVDLQYEGDSSIKGVDTRLYRIQPDVTFAPNADFYQEVQGIMPLDYLKGAPVFASTENQFSVPVAEKAKFEGVEAADWPGPTTEEEYWQEHGSYVEYEPITGNFIKGRSAAHIGFHVNYDNFPLWGKDQLPDPAVTGGHLYWPYMESAVWALLTDADAATIKNDVIGGINLAKNVVTAMWVVGPLFFVIGAALTGYGVWLLVQARKRPIVKMVKVTARVGTLEP